MPTVNISEAAIYNAAVEVKGILTGNKGIPVTAYTVEVTTASGESIRLATNIPSNGGDFQFLGHTPDNQPIGLPATVTVVTNRQAKDSKSVSQPPATAIGFLPMGSYQLTCTNIKVTLRCEAQAFNGSYIQNDFDLTSLANPDLWNDNGVIKATDKNAPQDGFKPGGSWELTSRSIEIVLTCEAQKIDGSWITASFDLTGLQTADLWNDNGVLKPAN